MTVRDETRLAIRRKAEALSGRSLGKDGDLLADMSARAAMAWCCRSDIPPEMEGAVAALALQLSRGGEPVKTVKRGDTAITYASGTEEVFAALAPWRRLGTLREDRHDG